MDTSDFHASGDLGVIVGVSVAYGENSYGEGVYGGAANDIVLNYPDTTWTNVDEP